MIMILEESQYPQMGWVQDRLLVEYPNGHLGEGLKRTVAIAVDRTNKDGRRRRVVHVQCEVAPGPAEVKILP
jgi:hypothetical protein